MAAITAVLTAILQCTRRSLRSAGSFTGNNLVAFIALLMAEEPLNRPSSTAIIYMMVGLLWVLPLSQELTRRIPSIRFRLWPLTRLQKAVIYFVNLLLNPLIAIAIIFGVLSRDRLLGLGLATVGAAAPLAVLIGQTLIQRAPSWSPLTLIPRFPGPFGGLIQSQVRELLQLLDFYLALITAVGAFLYIHFTTKPDPAASVVLPCLVILIMSTCAQGHVTFDAPASQMRLCLLPISNTAILLTKDAAWLLVTTPLVIAFHALPSLGAALAVIMVGHQTSKQEPIEQKRWSFCSGRLIPQGIYQMLALVAASLAVQSFGWPAVAPLLVIYILTIMF